MQSCWGLDWQRFETRMERLPVDAIEGRVLVSSLNVDKVQVFCDKALMKEFALKTMPPLFSLEYVVRGGGGGHCLLLVVLRAGTLGCEHSPYL